MNACILKTLAVAALAACAAHADIVLYNNGDKVEGFAETNDTTLRLYDRVMVNMAEFPMSMVSNIEFGAWIGSKPTGKEGLEDLTNSAPTNTMVKVASSNDLPPYAEQMQKLYPGFDPKKLTPKELFSAKNITFVAWLSGMVVFVIVSIVMTIVLIIDAFKNSILWGFLCLCCGPAQLIYLFTQYSGNKLKMAFWLFFPVIWSVIGQFLVIPNFLAK